MKVVYCSDVNLSDMTIRKFNLNFKGNSNGFNLMGTGDIVGIITNVKIANNQEVSTRYHKIYLTGVINGVEVKAVKGLYKHVDTAGKIYSSLDFKTK